MQGPETHAVQADAPLLLDSRGSQAMHVDLDVAEMLLLNLPAQQSVQDNASLLLDLPRTAINAG